MFHTRAIILSTKPYREHDELISLFTECFGKCTILARGTRKATSKLAASLHSARMAQCSFVEGRGYPILASLDQIQSGGQAKDFYAHYFLYAFLGLCDDIVYERDADERLWSVLCDVLQTTSTAEAKGRKEWIFFYDRWLRALLETLGVKDVNSRLEERSLLRKAFVDTYYRNPYPLEPFALLASKK